MPLVVQRESWFKQKMMEAKKAKREKVGYCFKKSPCQKVKSITGSLAFQTDGMPSWQYGTGKQTTGVMANPGVRMLVPHSACEIQMGLPASFQTHPSKWCVCVLPMLPHPHFAASGHRVCSPSTASISAAASSASKGFRPA